MKKSNIAIIALALIATGCTRIETGEVGLRVGFDKTIDNRELYSGTFNQTIIGDVLKFPIKELSVNIENKTPLTSDNTTLEDFDLNLVYSINQDSVSELWGSKSKSFHAKSDDSDDGEYFLMQNYLATLANNAVFKVVRNYKALELADNRAKIEQQIKHILIDTLSQEKLNNAIVISLVQIKNIALDKSIIQSANSVVTAQNALKTKEIEVQTAKQEALRIEALNTNSKAIEYMNAQSQMLVAQGIRDGKVQTVVVPYDFKGMVSIK
jgi:regulator of protease activity HflC (stomatin/prohibitin superfamily)